MSGEYGLKKDRDRRFFAGQFLWSGIDYIGEPTPYDVFPVKASFFGAVDTAGFPKDMYYLFRSQWTTRADGPPAADELDRPPPGRERRRCGRTPTSTRVELFLNGRSLGVRRFDHKTTDRRPAVPGDHRGHRRRQDGHHRAVPGQLHQPERQRRQAAPDLERARSRRASSSAVARATAASRRRATRSHGRARRTPCGSRPTARDRRPTAARWPTSPPTSSTRHGVVVPDADNLISFAVTRRHARRRSTTAARRAPRATRRSTRTAFNGKALAIVQSGTGRAPITRHRQRAGAARRRTATLARRRRHRRAPPPPRGPRRSTRAGRADRPAGRRELLRRPGHAARGDARRRPGHRLVELLRQGRHRAAAGVQPRARGDGCR